MSESYTDGNFHFKPACAWQSDAPPKMKVLAGAFDIPEFTPPVPYIISPARIVPATIATTTIIITTADTIWRVFLFENLNILLTSSAFFHAAR